MMAMKLRETIVTAASVVMLISLSLPTMSLAPIKAMAKSSIPPISAPVNNGSTLPVGQDNPLDKIEPSLLEDLTITGQTDFFVWMSEKADLSPAYQLKTKTEKGRFVFKALRETAERTQQALRAEFDQQGLNYRSFYIANKILVRGGNRTLLLNIASRPDVARITANHQFQLEEPIIDRNQPSDILAAGTPHTFEVNAQVAGYINQSRSVTPGPGGKPENFALTVDSVACIAPGYKPTHLYFEDFEAGFNNWSMTGLWNPESEGDSCGALVVPFPSSSNGAYYGLDSMCTYNNGSANNGKLTMIAPVTLPASGSAVLSSRSYEQTECEGDCNYDYRYVEISTDGGGT